MGPEALPAGNEKCPRLVGFVDYLHRFRPSPDGRFTADAKLLYRLPAFNLFPARATLYAIATACFWGFPAAISVRMFCDIAALPFPLTSGIPEDNISTAYKCQLDLH